MSMNIKKHIAAELTASAHTTLAVARTLTEEIYKASQLVIRTFKRGGTVFCIGNGGSAAQAQHLAAEFIGRFRKERRPLPAIALTTDSSVLTALANDYGGDRLFERSVDALVHHPADLLIAITTSGMSQNIVTAVALAKKKRITVVGLLGRGGGALTDMVDVALIVPSSDTARIQEAHITIGHIISDLVEKALCP